MTFPEIRENEAGVRSLADTLALAEENLEDWRKALDRSGAVLLRGFPLTSAEDFDALVLRLPGKAFTYAESLSNAVRINFTERVFTANEAPPEVDIYLHHEMAQTPVSPRWLFFFCQSAAERGGATPLCRSDQLFAALVEKEPELAARFAREGVRYTTRMPAEDDPESGQGRGWRSTLSVETRAEAEDKLRDLGYDFRWLQEGGLRVTSPRLPAVRELADGSQSFYNQLLAAYLGWAGVREDPGSALSYGDGEPISAAHLDRIVQLSAAYTTDLAWQDGDVALVDNHRVMHGRRAFSGARARRVLVAMSS